MDPERERPYVMRVPTKAELERAGRQLVQVLVLAEALPTRHPRELRFPPLTRWPSVSRPDGEDRSEEPS